ncbi:MAG TPA: 3-hydroxyacyl-CoA dehydrogenase NAD-binding domain-containing protein, partial [Acidimicrobiia bacterium]
MGVLGAGVMGSGIAQVCALAGFDVACHDVDPAALADARAHVTAGRFGLDGAVARGKVTREQADDALARITFTPSLETAATT